MGVPISLKPFVVGVPVETLGIPREVINIRLDELEGFSYEEVLIYQSPHNYSLEFYYFNYFIKNETSANVNIDLIIGGVIFKTIELSDGEQKEEELRIFQPLKLEKNEKIIFKTQSPGQEFSTITSLIGISRPI